MIAWFCRRRGLGFVVMLLVLAAGCGQPRVTHSSLSTTVNGRTVKASVDGPAFITTNAEGSVVVTFDNRKVVVEKDRVLWDEKEVATIPEDAKTVEVDFTQNVLTVTSDGKKVYGAEKQE